MPVEPWIGWLIAVVAAAMLAAAAVAAAWKARLHWRTARRLEATRMTPLSALVPGFGETEAPIQPAGRTLASPLTGRACVYYRFRVQQRRTEMVREGAAMRARQRWVTIIDEKQAVDAVLVDAESRAQVDLWSADMELSGHVESRTGLWPGDNAPLEKLLTERYAQHTRGFVFSRPFRVREAVLVPGTRVYVAGHVVQQPGGTPGFERGGDLLVVSDRPAHDVVRVYRRRAWQAGAGAVLAGFVALVVLLVPWFGGR